MKIFNLVFGFAIASNWGDRDSRKMAETDQINEDVTNNRNHGGNFQDQWNR